MKRASTTLLFLPLLGLLTWSPPLVTSDPVSFSQDGVTVKGNVIDLVNSHRPSGILRFSIGGVNVSKVTASKDGKANSETWNIHLEDKTTVRLHRSRPWISSKISEYGLEWPGAGPSLEREICFHYGFNNASWFSTYEEKAQRWPLDTSASTPQTSFTTRDIGTVSGPGSIIEYVFLNSDGFVFALDQAHPWFIRRTPNSGTPLLCFALSDMAPYETPTAAASKAQYHTLKFHLFDAPNLKMAYDTMIQHYTDLIWKPFKAPDARLFTYPIWSTWANFHTEVNQSDVLEYAAAIKKHNLKAAHIEIDDRWEAKYGDLTFDTNKFPNATEMIHELKSMGFNTSLWVYPFVNKDAHVYQEGLKYFVKNRTDINSTATAKWWHGEAGAIDFTHYEARQWFIGRLMKLRHETGVHSFKFDAGEANWYAGSHIELEYARRVPNFITHSYVEAASHLGGAIEVRAGFKSQQYPVFVRMFDKNSDWSFEGGLKSMITGALTMALAGYDYMLPDMVGGNDLPSEELYLRWVQATTFLPSMQFSVPPWKFSEKTLNLTRHFIDLHAEHAPTLISLAKKVSFGDAIIRPMWMAEPEVAKAYLIGDQFMVGHDIVVAPVLEKGVVERSVYLPTGNWLDQTGKAYKGPGEFKVLAPIETLPYFKRQH